MRPTDSWIETFLVGDWNASVILMELRARREQQMDWNDQVAAGLGQEYRREARPGVRETGSKLVEIKCWMGMQLSDDVIAQVPGSEGDGMSKLC